MLMVDLQDPSCVDQVEAIRGYLSEKRITLTERWGDIQNGSSESNSGADFEDPFALLLPTLLVASKVDQLPRQQEELEVFLELLDVRYPALSVSATSGEGLDRIGPWLFQAMQVVRVYTKTPGKPAEKDRPFTVRRGNTVLDVALLVHREFEETLRYARLWGHGQFDGQQVSRDHPVCDGDVLELHP
jgi:ribosome-interacting GTPase 1